MQAFGINKSFALLEHDGFQFQPIVSVMDTANYNLLFDNININYRISFGHVLFIFHSSQEDSVISRPRRLCSLAGS